MTRDVHWCVTVFYQPIENDNIANQIHGFTIDYGKFILTVIIEHNENKYKNQEISHKIQDSLFCTIYIINYS